MNKIQRGVSAFNLLQTCTRWVTRDKHTHQCGSKTTFIITYIKGDAEMVHPVGSHTWVTFTPPLITVSQERWDAISWCYSVCTWDGGVFFASHLWQKKKCLPTVWLLIRKTEHRVDSQFPSNSLVYNTYHKYSFAVQGHFRIAAIANNHSQTPSETHGALRRSPWPWPLRWTPPFLPPCPLHWQLHSVSPWYHQPPPSWAGLPLLWHHGYARPVKVRHKAVCLWNISSRIICYEPKHQSLSCIWKPTGNKPANEYQNKNVLNNPWSSNIFKDRTTFGFPPPSLAA